MKLYKNVVVSHNAHGNVVEMRGYDENKNTVSNSLWFDNVILHVNDTKLDDSVWLQRANRGISWSLNRLSSSGSMFFLVEMTKDEYEAWKNK